MTNRLSSLLGSSPSTMTRSMIRPVVSQSTRTRRRSAVLSMVVASHPTRSSKSRVKREPARANGTPWVSTPWVGQASLARSARICRRHRPRSRCRHEEATVRRSYRALVVNRHKGQASLRLRNRTVVVVTVRLRSRRLACPLCRFTTKARYDLRTVASSWRHLDLGRWRLQIRAELARLDCPTHGVLTQGVPFARAGSRFTRDFEDLVGWLATTM